jgi:hypothetical protein
MTLRCWQCGVEPDDTVEITTFGEDEPRLLPASWPPGDHPHAVNPPTPQQLREAGHAAMARILNIWAGKPE